MGWYESLNELEQDEIIAIVELLSEHGPELDRPYADRIKGFKAGARADAVAFNLAELRRHRQLTQVELADRLERAQASISAMETADDNLLSTVRSVVESMGGRLREA